MHVRVYGFFARGGRHLTIDGEVRQQIANRHLRAMSIGYALALKRLLEPLEEGRPPVVSKLSLLDQTPPSTMEAPPPVSLAMHVEGRAAWAQKPDVAILVLPAGAFSSLEDDPLVAAKNIAATAWDFSTVTHEITAALAAFNQIWVPSRACRNVLRTFRLASWMYRPLPVHDVPIAYDAAATPTPPARPPTDPEPQRYRFYWSGRWNTLENPEGVLRAFAHTFRRNEPVDLLLHAPGTSADFANERIRVMVPHRDRSMVIFDPSASSGPFGGVDHHDCYVSAARALCWDEAAFDAYLHRRHIIGSFENEFCQGTTADLLSRGTQAPAYIDPPHSYLGWTPGCLWWEPDLIQIGAAMRDAYDQRTRTLVASSKPEDQYGILAVARTIAQHLEAL
jgi:hypothetical protein